MKRNDGQIKTVLTDEEMDTLREALLFATEYARAGATVARSLGDVFTAQSLMVKAADFQQMLTYAPEVVRVAVTTETPEFGYGDTPWAEIGIA